MKRYEVNIPFKKGPWWASEIEAENKETAIHEVFKIAAQYGFSGKHSKPVVVEINN